MKYTLYKSEKVIYKTNSIFKLLWYAIFVEKNKSLFAAIISSDDRASSHEFKIYGNGIKSYKRKLKW